jgi:hypothetical protein
MKALVGNGSCDVSMTDFEVARSERPIDVETTGGSAR